MRNLFLALCFLWGSLADAKPPTPNTSPATSSETSPELEAKRAEEAQRLSNDAYQAYETNDGKTALSLWEKAYEVFPNPMILYNAGTLFWNKDELGLAMEAYTSYLKKAPYEHPYRNQAILHLNAIAEEFLKETRGKRLLSKLTFGRVASPWLSIPARMYPLIVGVQREKQEKRRFLLGLVGFNVGSFAIGIAAGALIRTPQEDQVPNGDGGVLQ